MFILSLIASSMTSGHAIFVTSPFYCEKKTSQFIVDDPERNLIGGVHKGHLESPEITKHSLSLLEVRDSGEVETRRYTH